MSVEGIEGAGRSWWIESTIRLTQVLATRCFNQLLQWIISVIGAWLYAWITEEDGSLSIVGYVSHVAQWAVGVAKVLQ